MKSINDRLRPPSKCLPSTAASTTSSWRPRNFEWRKAGSGVREDENRKAVLLTLVEYAAYSETRLAGELVCLADLPSTPIHMGPNPSRLTFLGIRRVGPEQWLALGAEARACRGSVLDSSRWVGEKAGVRIRERVGVMEVLAERGLAQRTVGWVDLGVPLPLGESEVATVPVTAWPDVGRRVGGGVPSTFSRITRPLCVTVQDHEETSRRDQASCGGVPSPSGRHRDWLELPRGRFTYTSSTLAQHSPPPQIL